MGTHPIFESDFDCLTDKKPDTRVPRKRSETSWRLLSFRSPSRTTIPQKTSVSAVPSSSLMSPDLNRRSVSSVMPSILMRPTRSALSRNPPMSSEAEQGQEARQEACQELRCLPCFRDHHQADSPDFSVPVSTRRVSSPPC